MGFQDDPGGAIVGIAVLFVLVILLVPIFISLGNWNHESQCAPEIGQIGDLKNQINAINNEKEGISAQLASCQKEYSDLVAYNITKRDFTDIKESMSQTNVYVNNIYSRLDNIETKINTFNRVTINAYNISFALNIVLSIEILSFAFLKNEFLQWIWSITFGKNKKKKQEVPPKTQ